MEITGTDAYTPATLTEQIEYDLSCRATRADLTTDDAPTVEQARRWLAMARESGDRYRIAARAGILHEVLKGAR